MSLALVQGYDSEEDERALKERAANEEVLSSDDESDDSANPSSNPVSASLVEEPTTSKNQSRKLPRKEVIEKKGKTGLPSAAFIFSEVSGAPEFLRPAALAAQPAALSTSAASVAGITGAHSHVRHARVESGPSIYNVATGNTDSQPGVREEERGKDELEDTQIRRKTVGALLPPKEDAAVLARVCETCQVPKTFSNARGGVMVCPLCGDKPKGQGEVNKSQGGKKREGAVKDKEKLKRMKGQSSHASWKSETEMQLRQTYD